MIDECQADAGGELRAVRRKPRPAWKMILDKVLDGFVAAAGKRGRVDLRGDFSAATAVASAAMSGSESNRRMAES